METVYVVEIHPHAKQAPRRDDKNLIEWCQMYLVASEKPRLPFLMPKKECRGGLVACILFDDEHIANETAEEIVVDAKGKYSAHILQVEVDIREKTVAGPIGRENYWLN